MPKPAAFALCGVTICKICEVAILAERSFGLDAWVDKLSRAELPALASVVGDLQRLAREEKSSVKQLADVLLRDATLTSKVLRAASSVYFNPSCEPIRTVSRAIVLLGFDNVRLITLSVSLIDGLLGKANREQLLELLARSFHAAVQARNLSGYVLARDQEEVFIAALLYHLGELAFWSCAGEQADSLAHSLRQPGTRFEETVQQLLGTSFRQLTQGLLKAWNLGELASLAQSSASNDPAVRAITLGVRISSAALEGWECPQMEALVEQVAGFIGVSPEDALVQILASADETVEVAASFGAERLSALIPSTDPEHVRLRQQARKASLLQPDLLLLQQSLQDLGLMASRGGELNLILDTLMKGLHQGAGLERVMLSVLAEEQTRFRCRLAVGEGSALWRESFVLPVDQPEQRHIFSYVLRTRETLWMGVPASHSLDELVPLPLRALLGQGMFFIAPILAGTREIGVLYADCRVSGRALQHEQFVAFQRFTQLAGRCLDALGKR